MHKSLNVVTFDSRDVGDRSYLIHDGCCAVVVDPQRDISRVLEEASRLNLSITHVLETHIHNDYVSGGLEMARLSGASYVVSADEVVSFRNERVGVRGGDSLQCGSLKVDVIRAPGHTPHHIAYAVSDARAKSALFSGGSLLFGTAGRTDLFSPSATELQAREQWRSIRRMVGSLEPDTALYPTHGFGSFCAAGAATKSGGTIGAEWKYNAALRQDEDAFVEGIASSLGPPPAYYTFMAPMNRRGDKSRADSRISMISVLDAASVAKGGGLVVDVRPRRDFAAGHISGSTSIELSDSFAAFFGWSTPWGIPVTLVGADHQSIERAAASLSRLGIDDVTAAVVPTALPDSGGRSFSASYPVADFARLRSAMAADEAVVVDAREKQEWESGHIPGALWMPFHCAEAGAGLLPAGSKAWVHCAKGFRASIAASIFHRLGHEVVLVDDVFENAVSLGLTTTYGRSGLGPELRRTA
jgi:hydroxyacylglutathione hydrolase